MRHDAHDAYQRALEIYLRRLETLDPVTEVGWLKVVVRHEAMAVRRARQESVAAEDPDLDARVAGEQRPVDERIASSERASRSAEALRSLKADEAKALMLKAEGHSYREIGERLGWTYTKVNRSITEGRAHFMKVFGRIEAGEECERFVPVLTAIVAGRARSDDLVELRPHLRHCARCRAAIRKLHLERRDRAAALIPLPVLVPLRWIGEKLGLGGDGRAQSGDANQGSHQSHEADPVEPPGSHDLPTGDDAAALAPQPDVEAPVHRLDAASSTAPSPAEYAAAAEHPAVAEHAAAAAEHAAAAAEHAERLGRLHQLKPDLYALLQRLQASDVATGVQLAGTTGGGRGASIAAILGFCLSSLGAGAYCVATGVLPDPVSIIRQDDRPQHHAKAKPPKRQPQTKPVTFPDPPKATPTATPEPKRARRRKPQRRRPQAQRSTASQAPQTPTAHEQPAVSPPTPGSTGEFSIEQSAPARRPKPAPARGGSEFIP